MECYLSHIHSFLPPSGQRTNFVWMSSLLPHSFGNQKPIPGSPEMCEWTEPQRGGPTPINKNWLWVKQCRQIGWQAFRSKEGYAGKVLCVDSYRVISQLWKEQSRAELITWMAEGRTKENLAISLTSWVTSPEHSLPSEVPNLRAKVLSSQFE